jgi:transcription initiation factor IIE alpha subunit
MAIEKDYPAEVSKAAKKIQKIVKDMNKDLLEEQELRVTADARIEELSNELQDKSATIERLERTINELKTTAEETTDLKAKNKALQAELNGIQTQLEKMSETYKELVSEHEASIPVQELLALYIALLEDVFYAQPHAKTLFLLHGRKKEMTREEIVKTAGHEPTAIRKALGDLSRAELIDYDVEAGKASLKKRLYPT